MKRPTLISAALAAALAGCATPSPQQLDQKALEVIKSSFRDQGIAKVDRLDQDLGQQACSSDKPPSAEVAARIQEAALASVKWPANGRYLGDWKEGEKLAQSGRGMTWTDAAGSVNGGSCYNCHQIGETEVSYGNLGPSLLNYGKIRGIKDPSAPLVEPIVRYTWAKLWNSKSYSACSNMPRFGHAGLLTEDQIRHVMALLLDPKSPVNR